MRSPLHSPVVLGKRKCYNFRMDRVLKPRAGMCFIIASFLAAVILSAGCAWFEIDDGASAADIPAPANGMIDISSPDEDGNVLITGSAGAVAAGSAVMAANETVVDTQASSSFSPLLVPTETSSDLPPICNTPGYACTIAGDDGPSSSPLSLPSTIRSQSGRSI